MDDGSGIWDGGGSLDWDAEPSQTGSVMCISDDADGVSVTSRGGRSGAEWCRAAESAVHRMEPSGGLVALLRHSRVRPSQRSPLRSAPAADTLHRQILAPLLGLSAGLGAGWLLRHATRHPAARSYLDCTFASALAAQINVAVMQGSDEFGKQRFTVSETGC